MEISKNFDYVKLEPMITDFIKLEGKRLVLEPLTIGHTQELCQLIEPEIWKWYTIKINTEQDMEAYVKRHIAFQEKKLSQTYVVRLVSNQRVVGSTRYLNIDKSNRVIEVGSTWYATEWQRTFVNTECKLLMLTYAFETLDCISVQFQTDIFNEASRNAIQRIGAKQDGILRNNRICEDGRVRSSAIFSITYQEWNSVKERLIQLLNRRSE